MMAEPKAHQLYKQVPGTGIIVGDYPSVPSTATDGWEVIDVLGAQEAFVFRGYVDLAGWSRQDLTTFTQGIDIQKSLIPIKLAGVCPGVYEFDFITTRRLTDLELGNLFNLPGFGGSTVDLMEVIYGERMIYAENATLAGTFVQIGGETFGSGNATAMDKLHWSRLVILHEAQVPASLRIYPTNLVVQAMTLKEKDLVWMERLRRSYVLQGEV